MVILRLLWSLGRLLVVASVHVFFCLLTTIMCVPSRLIRSKWELSPGHDSLGETNEVRAREEKEVVSEEEIEEQVKTRTMPRTMTGHPRTVNINDVRWKGGKSSLLDFSTKLPTRHRKELGTLTLYKHTYFSPKCRQRIAVEDQWTDKRSRLFLTAFPGTVLCTRRTLRRRKGTAAGHFWIKSVRMATRSKRHDRTPFQLQLF